MNREELESAIVERRLARIASPSRTLRELIELETWVTLRTIEALYKDGTIPKYEPSFDEMNAAIMAARRERQKQAKADMAKDQPRTAGGQWK